MKRKFQKKYSDEELLKGLTEHNHEVLQVIYRLYFPMIRNMVMQNSGNEDAAKDLFQEALMVLYDKEKKGDFVLTVQFHTYLYAVCKRLWLKQLHYRQKDPIFPGNAEEEALPEVEDTLADHEIREHQFDRLDDALDKLGSPCSEILLDFYAQELTMKQIAEKHHYTNTANAKTQKYKCLQRLKKLFFQQGADVNK